MAQYAITINGDRAAESYKRVLSVASALVALHPQNVSLTEGTTGGAVTSQRMNRGMRPKRSEVR